MYLCIVSFIYLLLCVNSWELNEYDRDKEKLTNNNFTHNNNNNSNNNTPHSQNDISVTYTTHREPILPISAQLQYNIDVLCEYTISKIPPPIRDFT